MVQNKEEMRVDICMIYNFILGDVYCTMIPFIIFLGILIDILNISF